jgi:hypothetical protein
VGLADGEPRGAVWKCAAALGCASQGNNAAIKALLAARADVHAKDKVRVWGGGGRLGGQVGGAAWGLHCNTVVWNFEPGVIARPNP